MSSSLPFLALPISVHLPSSHIFSHFPSFFPSFPPNLLLTSPTLLLPHSLPSHPLLHCPFLSTFPFAPLCSHILSSFNTPFSSPSLLHLLLFFLLHPHHF